MSPASGASWTVSIDERNAWPAVSLGGARALHAYERVGELEKNPIYAPNSIDWMAAAQIVGRPLSVSEWNVEPFPVPNRRHTLPLYFAASASPQA